MAKAQIPLPRIDVLVLSSLVRAPMHGYEIKLELRYKHVRWWAKCEHGHLYTSLKRLEARRLVQGREKKDGKRARRVYTITAEGRRAVTEALRAIAVAEDQSYFDVDLFVAGTFMLDRDESIALLDERARVLETQHARGQELRDRMGPYVPAVGRLIMDHRIEHLEREIAFAKRAADAMRHERAWGSFLGEEPIADFVDRTKVALEHSDEAS